MSTENSQPQARLFCRGGRLKGTTFNITGAAILGRSEECQCRVDDPSVASQHARLRWDGESKRFIVEDLGSEEGTEIDGAPVRGSRPLDRLHVMKLGGISFVFQQIDATPSAPKFNPKTQRLDAVPTIPVGLMMMEGKAPVPSWTLEVEVEGEWLRFPLSEGENRVGRVSADVTLPSREISRLHAVVIVDGREVRVRDLGSTNFTFLDGQRLLSESRIPLGGSLSFGPHPARVVAESEGS